MPPKSIIMLDKSANLIFNTSHVENVTIDTKRSVIQNKFNWKWWNDKNFKNVPAVYNPTPIQQLTLTHDETDYLYYSRNITVTQLGTRNLIVFTRKANAFLVFVDGVLQAHDGDYEHDDGIFVLFFPLNLTVGNHELVLLSVSLGIDSGVIAIS